MGFLDPLIVECKPDGITWLIHREFRFADEEGNVTYIPAGGYVDFASIPRLLWTLVGSPATGLHRRAAALHDWAYRTKEVKLTRLECDQLFLTAMIADGVGVIKRQAMYRAVRLAGGSSYVPRVL